MSTHPALNNLSFKRKELYTMRFTVDQKTIVKELDLLRRIATRKLTHPSTALSCILFQVIDSEIILSASDSDMSFTTKCPVSSMTATETGSVIIRAAKLCDIIQDFDNHPIDFDLLGEQVRIRCNGSEYKMTCESVVNFPSIETPETYQSQIPAKTLLGQIIRTQFAIPNGQIANSVKGVLLNTSKNIMSMTAVDGNQCPYVRTKINSDVDLSVIIPENTVNELSRLLSIASEGESVSVGCDENHAYFKLGDRIICSKILAGNFPNVQQMFSQFAEADHKIVVLVEPFIKALKRAVNMSDEKAPSVVININENMMEITSSRSDGDAKEPLKIASNGLKTQIGFDTRYLLPTLSTMIVDKVQIEIQADRKNKNNEMVKGSELPILLKPIDEKNFDWKIIVMPKRLL